MFKHRVYIFTCCSTPWKGSYFFLKGFSSSDGHFLKFLFQKPLRMIDSAHHYQAVGSGKCLSFFKCHQEDEQLSKQCALSHHTFWFKKIVPQTTTMIHKLDHIPWLSDKSSSSGALPVTLYYRILNSLEYLLKCMFMIDLVMSQSRNSITVLNMSRFVFLYSCGTLNIMNIVK